MTELHAAEARQLAGRIDASMRARVPIYVRVRRQIDPRRLIRSANRITMASGPSTQASGDGEVEITELDIADEQLDTQV